MVPFRSVMSTPSSPLANELAYFNAHRSEWLAHYAGKFALIRGEELVGTFSSFPEAYSAGVDRFGSDQFLVRQIVANDPQQSVPALVASALFAYP